MVYIIQHLRDENESVIFGLIPKMVPRQWGCTHGNFKSPGRGWEFFSWPLHSDRLWGPPSFLSNRYRVLFPWDEAAGAWNWPL